MLIVLSAVAVGWIVAWRWRAPAWRGLEAQVAAAEALLAARGSGSLARRAARAIEGLSSRIAPERLAQIHALTGLPTREPLLEAMAADKSGTLALICLLDFDRLSAFDPKAGEQLLTISAERLRRMAAPSRLVAHVDRRHLAVWIPDEGASADREIDALVYALADAATIGGKQILPDVGLRKARVDDGEPSPQAALARSLASFSASSGAALACAEDEAAAREAFALEQDLRQAIAKGELRLQFQPLIDAGAGRVTGAEALMRWRHPERGLIPPSRFVPIMEAAGLAPELGLWALNAAAREAAAWRTAGMTLSVAVNVSGRQLEDADFHLLVERTLARHALRPDALEIELTETVATAEARADGVLQALRRLGARLAIDDFGTGYSSLATLRASAFDKIKIDRAFVTDVDKRRDSQAICQSVLTLGRGLGVAVLAEGVETAAEFAWLRRHGCRHFQGYYFSPPLDEAAFLSFVRDPQALARLLASPPRERDAVQRRLTA